ncbi:hypothetical protein Tco_1350357 [Tanacetum coccineum]
MVNVIPPDHVDDVPVVKPNQHDDVPVIPEPVLVDEDEDPEEEEFEEEEEPQEEEDDMEVNIEEDENKPELTYPYEEVDPLNSLPLASDSETEDVIEVEDTDSDGLLPGLMRRDINSLFGRMASLLRRLCGRETAHALVEKKRKAKDEYYGKLILDLGNEVCSSVEQGTTTMEKLVEKVGNAEETDECKKIKKELEEARFSNTLLRMQNERVERDIYWTRIQAHEFYREMIHRGFVFKKDQMKLSMFRLKMRRVHHLSREDLFVIRSSLVSIVVSLLCNQIMPLNSAPLTQDAIRQMIKESIDAAIAAEWARHANARNDARGSRPVRGQDAAPVVRECTFAGFMNCNPTIFHEGKKVKFTAATLFNELALMCPRMVEPGSVKIDAYIQGLSENIKGEVTSSKPANLNEAMRMTYKLMEQKLQARDERILEGKKRKWENFQSGCNTSKMGRSGIRTSGACYFIDQ